MQAADARAAGQRTGLDVELVFCENNAIQQIQQLYSFIHAPEERRPAALVVETVTAEGMERVARNALKAGMKGEWFLNYRGGAFLLRSTDT